MSRATTPDGHPITSCEVPTIIPPKEEHLYKAIHKMHCARKTTPGHECQGVVSLDKRGVTLRCGLCGDSHKIYSSMEGSEDPSSRSSTDHS